MRPSVVLKTVYESLKAGSSVESELGSVYIKGSPGIGKSELVKGGLDLFNKERGEDIAQLIDIRLTLSDPTDLKGMPYPDRELGIAEWFIPGNLPSEKTIAAGRHKKYGILFFDDFTTAPPLVQSAAFQLFIQPHQLGDYQLPVTWVVIGAGNKLSDRANAHKMPKPLANRLIHINYEFQPSFVDDWVTWAFDFGINRDIIGFLSSPVSYVGDKHLLYNFDPQSSEDSFATPRSWARVSRILEKKLPRDLERELVAGTIGNAASGQYFNFVNLLEALPDVKRIIRDGDIDLKLPNAEHRYAMIVALANSIETANEINYAIKWAHRQEMEFAVLLMRMINSNPKVKENIMNLDGLKEIAEARAAMLLKVRQTRAVT